MRYFFNLVSDQKTIIDAEGVEAVDLVEVQREAVKAVDELRRSDASISSVWAGWFLEVATETGIVVARIDITSDPPAFVLVS